MPNLTNLTPEIIKNYQEEISKNSSVATVKRKSISLNKFFDWAQDQGHINANPMKPQPANENPYIIVHPTNYKKIGLRTFAILGVTTSLVIIIFLLLKKLPNAIQFIKTPAQEITTIDTPKIVKTPQKTTSPLASGSPTISANPTVNGSWNLYASLKLADDKGTPLVGQQTITFKVFNSSTGGTALYQSGAKSVTTDANGSALISLDSVPQNLFFENNKLYLEPQVGGSTMEARIPISTANVSANLNGYFPSETAKEQTIPVIDSTGSLVLASQSPAIKATSGNFLVEGQALTLKTADGTDGNIEINPDGKGITHFLFEGTGQNFLNAQAPNLTKGSLYYGIVANNATGYDLVRLQNGSGKPVTRFSIDSLGNTFMTGNETVKGSLSVNGIANGGSYNQTSGNFTVNQNTGDFASITKTGSALADVLTLTLDERNKPTNPNSNYSTLVLNRYDGSNEAAALKVANGNAIFNGQLQLGRYAGTPSGIGQGSLVYNTSDNQVYVFDGTNWTSLGSGSGIAFNNILSGTNTSATMLVGTGASLGFTGSGTINASSLNSLTSSQFLRSDTSTGSNGQILTTTAGVPTWTDITSQLTAGTDISITGTTNATIANTSTLNSVTGRGATTSNTITVGNLIDNGLTASKLVFTDGSKQLTSTGTVPTDQGGTGFSSYTVGDILYADTTSTLAKLNDVATGNALISGGAGVAPSWGKIVLGTHTTGNYVSTITGTANQITASASTGDITLSIPSDFRVPGTIQLNGITYTFPSTQSSNFILATDGSGTLTWADPSVVSAGSNYWNLSSGILFPKNSSADTLLGGDSTASAKFAFINTISGTPTASIAGSTANVSTYLTGNGNLATTNMNHLTLGGSTTGQVDVANDLNLDSGKSLLTNGTTRIDTSGNFTANNLTVNGNVASNLIPSVNNTYDLGSLANKWANVYATTLNQNGNSVCDTSGNCANSGPWAQGSGIVYTNNNSSDVLIGANSTESAKFAFTGVSSGIPTASVSGTYLTADGTLQTTNMQHLTLGGSTTGQVDVNNNLNLTTGNSYEINGTSVLSTNTLGSGVINSSLTSVGALTSGSIASGFGSILTTNGITGGTLTSTGTTTFGGITYTWPASQTTNYVLTTDGSGTLSWTDPSAAVGASIYWEQANGVLNPKNSSVDVLIGATSSQSAKFAFTGVNSGTPTASISGTYLTSTGNLSNTSMRNLTLGSSTTGNVIINSRGQASLTANGANLTTVGTFTLPNNNTISGQPNFAQFSNGVSIGGGTTYYFSSAGDINSNGLTVNGTTNFVGKVGSNILPLTNNAYDLGSSTFKWANVYATAFTQNGNTVCDSSDNCLVNGPWVQGAGVLNPKNSSVDLLVGANSTASAKFAITGVIGNSPTATLSGTYLTSAGNLATTNMQHLTLGGVTTGQVDVSNDLNLSSGKAYLINGTSVLNTNTLGSGVINSSLTSVGALTSGSIASGFGTISTTNGITGGTLTSTGTTTFGGITYTWPGSQSTNYILSTDGSGTLSWVDPASAVASTIYWTQANGVLNPKNSSVDILIGANSTASAKFAFTGVNSGTPTASVSGTYLTADGALATTKMQHLTLGGTTTGQVDVNNNLNVSTGNGYLINNASVLNATTLGSSVVNSSLTQVGALASGSIASGFGSITTTNGITGGTLTSTGTTTFGGLTYTWPGTQNANYVLQTNGAGTLSWVDANSFNYWDQASGALFTKNNTVDFLVGANSTVSAKFAITGVNSNSPTATLSGTYLTSAGNLATTNMQHLTLGGVTTGQVDVSNDLNLASGKAYLINGTSVLNTNTLGSGVINSSLTSVGALASGSIASGFGTISTSNNINGSSLSTNSTQRIDNSGNLTNIGTTQLNGITYTWPGSQTTNYVLQTNGAGTLSWVDPASAVASTIYWTQANGVLNPKNNSVDVLIGANSTTSAKFAFTGVASGTPTASIAGTTANVATYLTGEGNLATINMNHLTLGGSTTGQVDVSNDLNLASGKAYLINNASVLNATTLGSSVVNSSLTSLGNLVGLTNNGNTTLGDATSDTITITGRVNSTVNPSVDNTYDLGSSGLKWANVYATAFTQNGNTVCDTSGNCSNNGPWAQGAGVVYTNNNSSDVLIGSSATSSAKFAFTGVNSGTPTASVSGTYLTADGALATTKMQHLTLGGTTTGQVDVNNNLNVSTGNGYLINNASVLNATTLGSSVVNSSLTQVGALASGSIASGFGTISTSNNINGSSLSTNSTQRIDNSGNLTNIGTTQLNGITYTWPASQTTSYILQTDGAGTLSWVDPNTVSASTIYWNQANGILYPKNNTVDVLIGATSSQSAKFAFTGVNSGTPTASVSGTYLTSTGILSNTSMNALTIGSSTTGNVTINSRGNNALVANGLNLTAGGTLTLPSSNVITGLPNFVQFDNGISIGGATTYYFDSAGNINANAGTFSGNVAVNGGSLTTTVTGTANLFNANATTLNIGGASTAINLGATNLALTLGGNSTIYGGSNASGTLTLSSTSNATKGNIQFFTSSNTIDENGNLTLAGNATINGNTTLGNATSDTITVTGRVNSNILPSVNATDDLGSLALAWNNIYGTNIYQNGNLVCDSAGTNCPVQFNLWNQANGSLYPNNNSVDLLIGSDSTASAKFAIVGVNGSTPTATLSGTYLTSAGNLANTSMRDITLGGSTTGNVIANSPLQVNSLTASKGVFTDANKKLTSTGVLGTDQGGTGLSSYTTGDLIYASATNTLSNLADVATGNVLISGGVGTAPSWGKVVLGTHTTGNYVSSLAGTANQITASASTGDITLSIPSDFRAPGTVNAVNGLYTGATAGTQRIDNSGNLTNIGTTQLNGITYTWPASQANTYVLQTNGSGTLTWVDPSTITSSTIYWEQANGILNPKNNTVDVLIGANSTSSAKFAFTGVNSGIPTASVSGTYLTADGTLQTTNMQHLTLGGSTTGQVDVSNDLNLASGKAYLINNASVLNSTTLGGSVVNSSLTSLGNLVGLTNNGNTTLGDATSDTITITGRVNSTINPSANNTYDLGSSGLKWANVYATAFNQNGNTVCDSSGNCPGATNYWNSASGAVFTTNNTVDLLIGSSATTSAKFAFTGVNSGTPTASISGSTANVATYITGEGNLATTNMAPLTIGGATTGSVQINPKGSTGLFVDGSGKVGIASTSPGSNLDIKTNSSGTSPVLFRLYNESISGGSGAALNFVAHTSQYVTAQIKGMNNTAGDVGSGNLVFSTSNSTSLTEKARIDKFGNLGVGTSSPTALLDVAGAASISGSLTFRTGTGTIQTTAFNPLIIGGATTGNITLNPSNAIAGGYVAPNITNVSDLGTASLLWRNVYATAFNQNGNTVCDTSGNCSNSGPWAQGAGVVYTNNNSSDVLIGSSATTSAKFAFTGVNSGTPTASISGSTANVATYITGNGNLTTTNMSNLTLGGTTTGQVILNSNGNNALIANGLNLTAGGTITLPNSNTLSGVSGYTGFSGGVSSANDYYQGSSKILKTFTTGGLGVGLNTGSSGNYATFLGLNAGQNSTGNYSTGIGAFSLSANTGAANSAFGYEAGLKNTSGLDNTYFGYGSGYNNLTGSYNTLVGHQAGFNTTSSQNVFIGTFAGYTIANGGNTGIGYYNLGNATSTVTSNTAIGYQAGYNATGSTNVYIGYQAGYNDTGSNHLYIANSNTATPLIYGDFSTATMTVNGNLSTTGNTQIGNAITDTIDFQARVLQDADLIPITTTGTNDLGSASLPWDNVYAVAFNQNGNTVCDSSGNCPGSTNYWNQASGVLYNINNTVDFLVGASSTSSAKFAITGVSTSTPTATLSGTYLTSTGNLATTNMQHLTLGGTTTGQVDVSNDLNLASGKAYLINNASVLNSTTLGGSVVNSSLTSLGNLIGLTNNGNTTLGDATSDTITFTGRVNSTINPSTDNTYDLGSSGLKWANVYATTFNQNGNTVCDSSLNCQDKYWQLNNKIISPANSTYDLTIGSTATGSAFQAFGIEKTTGDILKLNSSVITSGNVFEATASAITSGNIIKLGNGGNNGNFTGNGIFMDFDNTGGSSFTGNFLKLDKGGSNVFAINSSGDITTAGDLTITPAGGQIYLTDTATLNVGGITNVAYNAFANASDTPTATNITADNDLFIGGDLEIKSGLYLTGKNIYNVVGGVSTTTVALASDPSLVNSFNFLGYGSWLVQNNTNNGIASLMVDQVKNGDIFTASASGVTKFTIDKTGNITNAGSSANFTFSGSGNHAISNSAAGTNLTIDAGTSGLIQIGNTSTGNVELAGGSTATGCTIANATGTLTCSADVVSAAATANLFNSTTTNLSFAGAATTLAIGPTGSSGSITLSGGSADTGCTIDGTTGNLTCSGNIASTATSGTQGWWQLTNKVLSPANSTYDLAVGSSATSSAKFQAFGTESLAGDILKLNSTVVTTGNLFEATSSAITTGNIVKLGTGGNGHSFSGNGIFMDFDNTGGGNFTGNFIKFNNSNTTVFAIDSNGKLVDQYVTAGIAVGATNETALTGFGATSIVGALNELKNTNKNISHNDYVDWANIYLAKNEGTLTNPNGTPNGLFFDTFLDSTKIDGTNSTSSGTIRVSDNSYRVGLTGGQTYNTATNDNDSHAYLGSNTVNDIYYYDRTGDSSPKVQVELGIDPNWYNGVTLSIATSSAQYSQNGTIEKKNPNLTTSYNGSLIKATGTDTTPRTIYITIKTPTTFDWTNYQGDAATGVTITPGTAQTLGVTGVSVTFSAVNYNVGDVFKIASWYIEGSSSTRGTKQQFPERSNIIAGGSGGGSGYIDIIDADTQKLWMRFSHGGTYASTNSNLSGDSASGAPTTVKSLNGSLYSNAYGNQFTNISFTTDSARISNATWQYTYNGTISQRNSGSGITIINSNLNTVSTTVNDVDASVIPNQPTQEVTVSGWGYMVGTAALQMGETFKLPYNFNNAPIITLNEAGTKDTTAPSSIADCRTDSNDYYSAAVEDITTNSALVRFLSTDGGNFPTTTYYCYAWSATGVVSPKQFVAVSTGAANSDGGATIINETDGSKVDIEIGSQLGGINYRPTKLAMTSKGDLYITADNSTTPRTALDVYYGVAGLSTETTIIQYRNGYYGVGDNLGWSGNANGPVILGTATTGNQITSLSVTEGTSTIDGFSNTIYVGTANGVSVIQEKNGHGNYGGTISESNVEASGSVKYYTKDYVSEEMVGDIRGMWPLNNSNTSSDFEDVSIKGNTLTGTNITAGGDSVSGVRNTATDFDGSTEYMSCTDASCGGTSKLDIGTGNWSTGAWIKTSNSSAIQIIIGKGTATGQYAYNLRTNASGQAQYLLFNTSDASYITTTGNTVVADNKWHFVAGTYDGTTINIYVDGQLEGSSTTKSGTQVTDSTSNFEIGGRNGTLLFSGSIDEAFVTGTSLTNNQIKNMYQVGYHALQSHSTSLGSSSADSQQQLGYISTGTNSVGDIATDFNNQYMYVGLNSTTLGGLSKIQLNSDTNIKTFTASSNVPTGGTNIVDEDVTSLGVGYQLEAVGSAASGVKSMAPDNNANGTVGSLFSKTQTLASGTKFAYLWTNFAIDSSDATSSINVYACNSQTTQALCTSNNAWVLGTIVQTDNTQNTPEREYSFSFPTAGTNMTFKFDFKRGSTKTNTYIERYGSTWASSVGGADIAERYQSTEPVFPGDILSIDAPPVDGEASVKLSTSSYDPKLIGIVTTNPGIVMDDNLVDLNFNAASRNSPNRPAVALAGRVPVKVSTKNGNILVGDPITSSDIAGVGIKATKAGNIVGKALESLTCEDTSTPCEEKIMVLLNVSWFDPDVYLTSTGDLKIVGQPDPTNVNTNFAYRIIRVTTDGVNEVVDRIGTFGEIVVGNIKAGAISTQDFVTENLVAKTTKTNLITPLDGSNDIAIQIGSIATPSGKLAIKNAQDEEVASIDNLGNASFAGIVRSQNIDEIQALLTQIQADQGLLSQVSETASPSAVQNLDSLTTNDIYFTNQITGLDFSITGNSINSLATPLKIQSLGMANIELMAGLVTIDTSGNVNIAGNLNVAGKITTPTAEIKDITIDNFTIANTIEATDSAEVVAGIVTSNATAGKAIIPAGTNEITIKNNKVNDYTLVYATPTSSTENNVLYVKSKEVGQFVIGFTNALTTDVNLNWWIVQIKQ